MILPSFLAFLAGVDDEDDESECREEEDAESVKSAHSDASDVSEEEMEELDDLMDRGPEVGTDLMDQYELFAHWYKRHWLHYRKQLLSDYVRVAYCMSPNPKVKAHWAASREPEDRLACERLLVKLFVPGYIEGEDSWEKKKCEVVNQWLDEMEDFHNKQGYFKSKSIWFAAEELPGYIWHARYSKPFTKYLGALACIVMSKVTGCGDAERNWKENKAVRSGQRARLSADKAQKQATISAAHSLEKSLKRAANAKRSGKLMTDEDFESLRLGEFGVCIDCFNMHTNSPLPPHYHR
jgi:hypothetical protein